MTENLTMERSPATATPPRWRTSGLVVLMLVVLSCSLLAGAYVAYYQTTRPAVYRSTATLLIDQPPAVFATGNEGIIAKLSELRIKYTSLVGTATFAQPVAERAGLPVGKVRGALSATAPLNTVLVTVSARSSSAALAHTIAQNASEYLSEYVLNEQTSLHVNPKDAVTLNVVTPAGPGVKTGPSEKKAILEGAAVFVAAGVVLVFLADLLRRRRWT